MRHYLSFGALLFVSVACGGTSSLGLGGQDLGSSGGSVAAGGVTSAGGSSANGGSTAVQCQADGECAVPDICRVCPNGGSSCATGSCVNGECQISYPACSGGNGGSTGAGGSTSNGGSAMGGGGASGGGGGAECTTAGECPVPAICTLCSDGSSSCATGACVNGKCETKIPPCGSGAGGSPGSGGSTSSGGSTAAGGSTGSECTSAAQCAVPQICEQCPTGGGTSCATAECVNGHCQTSFPGCTTTGSLKWFTTCGGPCRAPGAGGATSVTPGCAGAKAGDPCTTAGATCPGTGCGGNLECATSDPTLGKVCPL